MSAPRTSLTVADRARRAADNIDQIAIAATGDQPAAQQLFARLVETAISTDMIYVLDWIKRHRDALTAAVLRKRTNAILRAMHKAPLKTATGALVLDLFGAASQLAAELRTLADEIEAEESQRSATLHREQTNRVAKQTERHLSNTERRILSHCRRKAHTGERIAIALSLTWDHIRRLCARLVREGHLRKAENGYRTV
jgi:hypothetical protein